MDKEHLSDAIGNISDAHIEEATQANKQKNRFPKMIGAAAAVIILAIAAVILLPKLFPKNVTPDTTTNQNQETADASTKETESAYAPETTMTEPVQNTTEAPPISPRETGFSLIEADYPDGNDSYHISASDLETLYNYKRKDGWNDSPEFTKAILSAFLNDSEGNQVFSPFSLYQSLATLAEISSGNTRAQILDLLNTSSIEELRKTAKAMWLNAYCDGSFFNEDDAQRQSVIPSNSFWLNQTVDINGDASVADILKNDYYTSFYKGDPADEAFQEHYRKWLNDKTGGLLEDAVKEMRISPDTVFSLINTLYLKASWNDAFDEKDNTTAPFYGTTGTTSAEYMHNTYLGAWYYKGTHFSAVALGTASTAGAWMILPDEGYSLNDLIGNADYEELLRLLPADFNTFTPPEGYDMYEIDVSLPKFDVTGSYDLKDSLTELGVQDAFDADKAEIPFVKAKNGANLCITDAKQDVTLSVNEKGISASAITNMGGGFGDPIFYHVDFNMNRPFLMLVTTQCNTPLFAVAINTIR